MASRPTQRQALSCAKVVPYTRSSSDIKEQQHSSRWFKFLHLDLELCTSASNEKLHSECSSPLSAFALIISSMGFTASSPPVSSNLSPSSRSRNRLIIPFLTLCLVSFIVLLAVLGSGSRHRVYNGYRRLQEGTLQALSSRAPGFDLGNPSLKNTKGCPDGMENYVPCYGFSSKDFDRHCESFKEKQCVVKPPKGYKLPMKWPASNRNLWSENLKVASEHSSRILIEENIIRLPSEESLVEDYVVELERMISGGNNTFTELGIRLVLDVGSGFGAFASALLTKNVLTMSIDSYEQNGGAVQFALERGLPAMIGSLSSLQLPFPFSSYDLIHCRSCGVEWHQKDGVFLLEVNRMLRPGGYFIWTPSSLNKSSDNLLRAMGKLATSICWSQVAHNDRTIIWQKTTKQRCYTSRRITVPVCKPEPAAKLQPELKACITEAPKGRWRTVQQQHKWPNRMMLSARRLSRYGMSSENFTEDMQSWLAKLTNYWSLFTPVIFSDHPKRPGDDDPTAPNNVVRNIMDMNAQYGAFNAALLSSNKPVWVMNIVPSTAPNTLTAVYDRGLLGARHDWCEGFPAYPRSYDLLYGASLLSQELGRTKPCGLPKLVLEMDRLLRPEGWILLQDEKQVIETARSLLVQIRWEARIIEIPGESDQRLLVGQKNWRK